MERTTGVWHLLSGPWVYGAFQTIVGGPAATRWLVANHWKIEEGMSVVDVGCGPAKIRRSFPSRISYFGFDPNPDYIDSARAAEEGEFHVGTISDFLEARRDLAGTADVVVCSGVLHHLTPGQMDEVLEGARRLLRPGGRFAALEPTWLTRQDHASRWVLSLDRGQNILHDFEWAERLREKFETVEVRVANRLIRIPYTYALITAWTEAGSPRESSRTPQANDDESGCGHSPAAPSHSDNR